MKKILYTAPSIEHILRYHMPCMGRFRDLGFKVYLATGDASVARQIPIVDEMVLNPGLSGGVVAENAKQLASFIEAERFDIVTANGSPASYVTRRAVRMSSHRPALSAVMCFGLGFDEDTSSRKRRRRLRREKSVRKVTDLMMVMNASDYKMATANGLASFVARIPGTGVQVSRYAPASVEERRAAKLALGLNPDSFTMTCVGDFDKNHHQQFVIENMMFLPRKFEIVMIGEGENRDACADRVFKLGLEGVVQLPGRVPDLEPYLKASDAMLSACRYEGLPQSIIIGQAMGLPAVVSAVKGNLDVVFNGRNGLTYLLGNPDSFVEAMRTLLYDTEMRALLGEHASEDVMRYDMAAATEAIMECYLRALE